MASAIDIATAVRAGERRAVDVVDEHLAAIAAREDELHAFNIVLADGARAAAAAVDDAVAAGRRSGSARRGAGGAQGQHVHAGHPHHVLVADPRGLAARPTTPRW